VISAKSQLVAAVVATMLGIVAITGYGFHALNAIDEGARKVREALDRLATTADIEDAVRELGAGSRRGATDEYARLDELLARMHELEPGWQDTARLARFERLTALARADPTAENWFRAGEIAGEIEKALIRRTRTSAEEKKSGSDTNQLLWIGVTVVALCAISAAAVFFTRWQREQRESRERLRRSDRLAALGTIAASVAHEINNPLATISGCASAVRDRMKRQPGACVDSLEYLEMIEDESRRCTGILKGLRDLARDGPPAMTPADVVKLARSVIALLEVDRNAKPIVFELTGEDRLEAICDPDKIKQLLLNLLINSREASAPGARVTVHVERIPGDGARLTVADTGRGIEKRDLQRVFEPFHTDKTQGLGIGLFLCERIAALHGGTIRAQSDGRGTGARFVVEFPTRTSSQASTRDPEAAAALREDG
jgi:signal transduction histidine kinase